MPQNNLAIAFYNLENLFDTQNDPNIFDDDFTPKGELKWDATRYAKKLNDQSAIIAEIGKEETGTSPVLLGVAEVENKKVLNDLITTEALKNLNYAFVHHNSPDERGIDTALLYKKDHFEVLESRSYSLHLETAEGLRDFTRDILYVHGKLKDVPVYILVNHWPSRREGLEESNPKRILAAKRNREILQEIQAKDPEARIIIMGDFNDDPQSVAVRDHLVSTDFYNPMIFLLTRYAGSLTHRGDWYLFDQIILSPNWMKAYENPLEYVKSAIFNPAHLAEAAGKYKGNPLRTYAGDNYLGGPSDHFPVYTIFKTEPN
ncbi:endonuclease [Leeuwenhoekiella sp. MAR_2009_132]|uniref:endonuclease/exonuclease/phosphatase family protein n=1 Tax=Leeuwenhoekiella sp. MAR_2009_132 TaxID=1392489 RepID=UPI00048B19E2|nr:endonuclease [Leeuwenhoekiella sp. MAR_2009_132]